MRMTTGRINQIAIFRFHRPRSRGFIPVSLALDEGRHSDQNESRGPPQTYKPLILRELSHANDADANIH